MLRLNRHPIEQPPLPGAQTPAPITSAELFGGDNNFQKQTVSVPADITAAEAHFTPPVPVPAKPETTTPHSTFARRRAIGVGVAALLLVTAGPPVINNLNKINPFAGPAETELIERDAKTDAKAKKFQQENSSLTRVVSKTAD